MRWARSVLMTLTMAGCCECGQNEEDCGSGPMNPDEPIDPPPGTDPEDQDIGWYNWAPDDRTVVYRYLCNGRTCEDVAEPVVLRCEWFDGDFDAFRTHAEETTMVDCSAQASSAAETLGRGWMDDDCATEAVPESVEVYQGPCPWIFHLTGVYLPSAGSPIHVPTTVAYGLGGADAQGSKTLYLYDLTLTSEVSFTTSSRDLTALLGFPSGTRITLHALDLHGAGIRVDRNGVGSVPAAKLWITAEATVTEPGGRPVERVLQGPNPVALTVTATASSLSVTPPADPFGGGFVVN